MTTTETPSLREARERAIDGACVLDARHPGWWREIDLDLLDMGDNKRCVLGQVFGDYRDGRGVISQQTWGWRESSLNGFTEDWVASFADLRLAWLDLIHERRARDATERRHP